MLRSKSFTTKLATKDNRKIHRLVQKKRLCENTSAAFLCDLQEPHEIFEAHDAVGHDALEEDAVLVRVVGHPNESASH